MITPGLSYRIMESDSDRVCTLQVIKNGQTVMNIIGVCLPYYDDSSQQVEKYLDLLAKLQHLLDFISDQRRFY